VPAFVAPHRIRLAAEVRSSKTDGKNIADGCSVQINSLADGGSRRRHPDTRSMGNSLERTRRVAGR
jgi:hypothetical protein